MQLSEAKIEEIYNKVLKKYSNSHENRLKHIIGVANMAKELAIKYNVDPNKAYVAGLLHDYYKYEDYDTMDKFLSLESEKIECKKYPFLYHAYCSAKAASLVFDIKDEDIINAIHNHVFGRLNMSRLEEIIMISDYTEVNRKYDDCIKCRDILLNKGINEAIIYSLEKTIEHVLKNGDTPHPMQLEILKQYKEKIKC